MGEQSRKRVSQCKRCALIAQSGAATKEQGSESRADAGQGANSGRGAVGPMSRRRHRLALSQRPLRLQGALAPHQEGDRRASASPAICWRKAMRDAQRSRVVGLCVPYHHRSRISRRWSMRWSSAPSSASYEVMQVVSRQDPVQEFSRIERLVAFKVGGLMLVPSLEPQKMLDFLHSEQRADRRRRPPHSRTRARFDQVAGRPASRP